MDYDCNSPSSILSTTESDIDISLSLLSKRLMERWQLIPIANIFQFPLTNTISSMNNNMKLIYKAYDDKLNKNFQYFHHEFIDIGITNGIPIPMEIVEDTKGNVYNFIKLKGPKSLIQLISTYNENIQLVTSSLSLLLTLITILIRKIPMTTLQDSSSWNPKATTNAITITNWISKTLFEICDNDIICLCISIICNSLIHPVQMLAMQLLTRCVAISDDICLHLFNLYNPLDNQIKLPNLQQRLVPMIKFKKKSTLKGFISDSEVKQKEISTNMNLQQLSNNIFNAKAKLSSFLANPSKKLIKASKPLTSHDELNMQIEVKDFEGINSMFQESEIVLGSHLSVLIYKILNCQNNHYLLRGYADIICLLVCLDSSHIVCELIAKMPSCKVSPMISPSNHNNRWSGIDVLFNLLERYIESIEEINHTYIPNLREEVFITLRKTLYAISLLLRGSQEIVSYTYCQRVKSQDLLEKALVELRDGLPEDMIEVIEVAIQILIDAKQVKLISPSIEKVSYNNISIQKKSQTCASGRRSNRDFVAAKREAQHLPVLPSISNYSVSELSSQVSSPNVLFHTIQHHDKEDAFAYTKRIYSAHVLKLPKSSSSRSKRRNVKSPETTSQSIDYNQSFDFIDPIGSSFVTSPYILGETIGDKAINRIALASKTRENIARMDILQAISLLGFKFEGLYEGESQGLQSHEKPPVTTTASNIISSPSTANANSEVNTNVYNSANGNVNPNTNASDFHFKNMIDSRVEEQKEVIRQQREEEQNVKQREMAKNLSHMLIQSDEVIL